ncbi:MAG TPA: S24 family peptidase [Pyrinomonadaceae bacterium]|jgi:repressor LexA|nr:S24 family peptidase [Pyrinomonadaceae bacterium]
MLAPTRRQREILDFITHYIESHGARPSYQLIARHMGVRSKAGIARIVKDLETQGFLERRHVDGHFTIALTHDEITPASGEVVHWLEIPDEATDGATGRKPFALPEFMLGGHDTQEIRAFRVTDDALAEDGITTSDIALVELRSFARDGDIVAAVLKKERAVLRKYYRAGAQIELCSSDEGGEIIRLAADRVEIKGIFRGLLRPAI